MCLVQKEAQVLISIATEQFIRSFAQAMLATAERERRSTISVRDIGIIGRSSDRFLFLQGEVDSAFRHAVSSNIL
jgi:DNA polymerase epsilon subunit 4